MAPVINDKVIIESAEWGKMETALQEKLKSHEAIQRTVKDLMDSTINTEVTHKEFIEKLNDFVNHESINKDTIKTFLPGIITAATQKFRTAEAQEMLKILDGELGISYTEEPEIYEAILKDAALAGNQNIVNDVLSKTDNLNIEKLNNYAAIIFDHYYPDNEQATDTDSVASGASTVNEEAQQNDATNSIISLVRAAKSKLTNNGEIESPDFQEFYSDALSWEGIDHKKLKESMEPASLISKALHDPKGLEGPESSISR